MTTPTPGLQIRDARITYPGKRGTPPTIAVTDVDLTVQPGEILALLGPSGCGKSSLLRAVAGLEPLAHGTISWDGNNLQAVPVHRRGFGLMFQDGQLFPHRTVAGNIAYGLTQAPRAQRAARVSELLETVGLTGYDNRAVTELSGGEKQRVALARSLAPRPALLLLDEPLSALDRALREHLATELRDTLKTTGTTAIFVTHDHDEAATVADRIAIMDDGRVLQTATPAELWHRPATRKVAEFLGYEAFLAPDHPALEVLNAGGGGVGSSPDVEGRSRDVVALAAHALQIVVNCSGAVGPADAADSLGAEWSGRVLSTSYRRGIAEAKIEVDGLGIVTVLLPTTPDEARLGAEVRLGDVVELALDSQKAVQIPN